MNYYVEMSHSSRNLIW